MANLMILKLTVSKQPNILKLLFKNHVSTFYVLMFSSERQIKHMCLPLLVLKITLNFSKKHNKNNKSMSTLKMSEYIMCILEILINFWETEFQWILILMESQEQRKLKGYSKPIFFKDLKIKPQTLKSTWTLNYQNA